MLTGSCLFVTATDTDAGKSFLSAALSRTLLRAGADVAALKPVSCGRRPGALNDDVAGLLAAQGMAASQAGEINLYDFEAYAAPWFAARAEGRAVDVAVLAEWCRKHSDRHALSLIEGVGGLMVPLAEGVLVADWLQCMPQAKVLLLVRARLGGINQALLTLDKLHRMRRAPDWVVINAADGAGDALLADHCTAIAPCLGKGTQLCTLPWLPEAGQADQYLKDSDLFAALVALAM